MSMAYIIQQVVMAAICIGALVALWFGATAVGRQLGRDICQAAANAAISAAVGACRAAEPRRPARPARPARTLADCVEVR